MSRSKHNSVSQFYASAIFIMDEVCHDFAVGDIICSTAGGVWLRHVGFGGSDIMATAARDQASWPRRTAKGIQLYRDYWRVIFEVDTAPRTVAVMAAKKTQVPR